MKLGTFAFLIHFPCLVAGNSKRQPHLQKLSTKMHLKSILELGASILELSWSILELDLEILELGLQQFGIRLEHFKSRGQACISNLYLRQEHFRLAAVWD